MVVGQFSQRELDYIFACYGLAFALLAAVSSALARKPGQRLAWRWLLLFGLTHALHEWLEMLALGREESQLFALVRVAVMALSFLFLLEFGRSGVRALTGRGPGGWVHLPLAACLAPGGLAGVEGAAAAARYALGFTGGLLAAAALLLAWRRERGRTRALLVAAFAMAGYAAVAGLIPQAASFPPASWLNTEAFLAWAQVPVQLVRALLAGVLTWAIWYHRQELRWRASLQVGTGERPGVTPRLVALLVVVLGLGAWLTAWVGQRADRDLRRHLVEVARTAAAAVEARGLASLEGDRADLSDPDYQRAREQLVEVASVVRGAHWLYAMRREGERITFLVDSIAANDPGHADPGLPYRRPPAELFPVFEEGRAAAVGPYTSEWGSFVSGFAPIIDPTTKRVVAVLGVDVSAREWRETVAAERLEPISTTLLAALLVVILATAGQRLREGAQESAARAKRLAEAQRVAQLGSWTYDVATGEMMWSEEMFSLFGLGPEAAEGLLAAYRARFLPEDRARLEEARRRAMEAGESYSLETRLELPGGEVRCLLSRGEAYRGAKGGVVQLLGTEQDFTELRRLENQLRELTLVDELTGLNNRRGFLLLAAHQMRVAQRLGQSLLLIFADMDGMKRINDTYGHQEGDRALNDLASVLRMSFRASDVLARIGGDEFVCLAIEGEELPGEILRGRLQAGSEAHNLLTDRPYSLEVSMGLARWDPQVPSTLEELLARGDAAMYAEKQRRKGGVVA